MYKKLLFFSLQYVRMSIDFDHKKMKKAAFIKTKK